jgi:DNA-binding NtrC family response regulator
MAKILIADDERGILRTIQHLLNENGHETVEATNGLAALELFQTNFIDLIITDLRMPRMDGMTFLHEVRKLDSKIPIILMTAYASAEMTLETLNDSAFICLTKPFKADELLNTVTCALDPAKIKALHTEAPPSGTDAVKMAS